MHTLPTHTYHARTDQVVFFKLGPEPGGYLTWALNTHRQKKPHAPPDTHTHTHTHTQEDFHCQPTLGRPLRFYAIIFGNDFSGDAGEKCTGKLKPHARAVDTAREQEDDWTDPCEPADRSRVRGGAVWLTGRLCKRPAAQGRDVSRHKPLSFDTTIYWFLPASSQASFTVNARLPRSLRRKDLILLSGVMPDIFQTDSQACRHVKSPPYTVTHAMGIIDLKMIT